MASRQRTSRRRWSDTFKKRVVDEASQPGVTVAQIADRYDLDAKRIASWKSKFGSGAALVPVEVTADNGEVSTLASCVEIDLPCSTKVRCHSEATPELVSGIIVAVRLKR
jgi:transposase